MAGRPPIGLRAMTPAERQRRYREECALRREMEPFGMSREQLVDVLWKHLRRAGTLDLIARLRGRVDAEAALAQQRREEREERREAREQAYAKMAKQAHEGRGNDAQLARTTLGLGRGPITAEQVNKAYRAKARRLHPDVGGGGDSDTMTALQQARDTLLKGL